MPVTLSQVIIDLKDQAQQQALPGVPEADTAPGEGFGNYLSSIVGAVMLIATLLVLLYLLWAGFDWISSSGDSGKVKSARDRLTQSLIGLLILASVFAFYVAILQFLGIDSINVV
ncbi:MAG: hypothetical protein COU69_00670 [Candidatus Pacebacteria bacterium CG10_big_fil_rev_8_21_14_0_10_56_10]|nr:MAG: hypothetical protein COU69_00670 [Candidatus Pacebacteria bacterium CG10_big_fil_rev_8_21_14_0_10_56_10]